MATPMKAAILSVDRTQPVFAVQPMTELVSKSIAQRKLSLMLLAFFAIAMPIFGFAWPNGLALAAMVVNGLLNGIGQYWWTRSLSLAPPAAVGPFYYFSLVWAMSLGFLIWGDIPTLPLLAGSAIVVGSGLFLLWRETSKKPLIAE